MRVVFDLEAQREVGAAKRYYARGWARSFLTLLETACAGYATSQNRAPSSTWIFADWCCVDSPTSCCTRCKLIMFLWLLWRTSTVTLAIGRIDCRRRTK